MFILLVNNKWSSKSYSCDSETSTSSLIKGFHSLQGAGAVPSGGGHKYLRDCPSASSPTGCDAVMRSEDFSQSDIAFAQFPVAFVAGSLQGHWWGFISRNYIVWPIFFLMNVFIAFKGRGSSIGSVFACHASGPEFDPHVRYILSWRLGHENISTAILPLPLIQEEQLSVTGKRMCTKYW